MRARLMVMVAAIGALAIFLVAGGYRLGKDAAVPDFDAREVTLETAIDLAQVDSVLSVRGYSGRADLRLVDGTRVWTRLPPESQGFFNFLNQRAVPFGAETKMTGRSRKALWVAVIAGPIVVMVTAGAMFGRSRRLRRDGGHAGARATSYA